MLAGLELWPYNLKTASSADYLSKNSVTVKYEPDSAKGEAQRIW